MTKITEEANTYVGNDSLRHISDFIHTPENKEGQDLARRDSTLL